MYPFYRSRIGLHAVENMTNLTLWNRTPAAQSLASACSLIKGTRLHTAPYLGLKLKTVIEIEARI
jgi:hypothetical protein